MTNESVFGVFYFIAVIGVWFAISCIIVYYSARMPNIMYEHFGDNSSFLGNNSSANVLGYKDEVGFYLSAMLSSALVLVGSVQAYKVLYIDKNVGGTSQTKKN